MKKKSVSQSAFFNLRTLLGFGICLAGILLALFAFGPNPAGSALAQSSQQPNTGRPDIHRMVGPVLLNQDLRTLRYIPQLGENEESRLMRYPHRGGQATERFDTIKIVQEAMRAPSIPPPLLTFNGINSVQSQCGCLPPDTNGDVGPNHYVESVNTRFAVYDKNGNTLLAPTTFNSFFAPLVGTPCASQNRGDPYVFYDQIADRWVLSDFAFPSFPGSSFYQCIGVSQTGDPVAGGWFLYAIQVDPANPTRLGDYPKFALWPDAYYLTMNEFTNNTTFNGVRVYALDRASMIAGGPANAIGFTLDPTALGDSYSLVPASVRTGSLPPAGRQEFLLAVDSPASGGVTLTQVKGWLFHPDFANPANSTLGVGANHAPNALMTVNGFVDAFTTTTLLVPQQGTTSKLDTLGDKIMTPMVYQNRGGTESLYADQTVILNYPNGPTAVRWYQFNVTGGNFPAAPVQQQDWTNGNDGLWRWMPSIAVDQSGNMAIGYSASSASTFASIRYAGRLAADPPNNLGQGEAIMTNGGGAQTSTSGRWGDYSMTTLDPADNVTFWHANEYYVATGGASWATSIGKFRFTQALQLTSAVSRKVHGAAGTFDISLPGVECRTGGTTGAYTIVVTFNNNVVSGNATVTGGTGTVVGSPIFAGNTMTINLTGVTTVQTTTVTLSGVMDQFGQILPDTPVSLHVIIGDTTGDGAVNSSDVAQTKAQLGQPVGAGNFRTDVNTNGSISSTDLAIVKSHR